MPQRQTATGGPFGEAAPPMAAAHDGTSVDAAERKRQLRALSLQERSRIAELCKTSELREVQRIASRLEWCGAARLMTYRNGPSGPEQACASPVGCGCKLCNDCNATKRKRMGRKYGPQYEALLGLGFDLAFTTLTISTKNYSTDRKGASMVTRLWRATTNDKRNRAWFKATFAGGIRALEDTKYQRYGKTEAAALGWPELAGQPRCDRETGEFKRRPHTHLHILAAVMPGRCPREAGAELVRVWLAEAERAGLKALPAGQDSEPIWSTDADGAERAADYCGKYQVKTHDLLTVADCDDILVGLKGVRHTQPFGLFHGNALRASCSCPPAQACACGKATLRDVRAELAAERALWHVPRFGDLEPSSIRALETHPPTINALHYMGILGDYHDSRALWHATYEHTLADAVDVDVCQLPEFLEEFMPADDQTAAAIEAADLARQRAVERLPVPVHSLERAAELGDVRARALVAMMTGEGEGFTVLAGLFDADTCEAL